MSEYENEMNASWGQFEICARGVPVSNCKDFEVGWNTALGTIGALVGDEIDITVKVQFVEKA